MRQLLMMGITFVTIGVWGADTFTLKSSLSGVDFDWSAGSSYVGDPAEGPADGDTIIIPENMTAKVSSDAGTKTGICGICNLYISEGATLQMLGENDTKVGQTHTYVGTITGPGTVSQVGSYAEYLYIRKSCAFDGKITGKVYPAFCDGITFRMNNADQDYVGTFICDNNSTLEVARINPASGTGHFYGGGNGANFNCGTAFTFRYIGLLGLSETLNRTFYPGAKTTIDAGEVGKLTVTSYIKNSNSAQVNFILTGNTAEECVFQTSNLKGGPAPIYIIKEGTGTWIANKNTGNYVSGLGVFDVRNGTLKFDELKEKGVNCDLGYGTALYKAGTSTALNDANRVDHQVILGGLDTDTEGVLRYNGTDDVDFTTRKLAVRSKGKLVSDTAAVTLNGVTGNGDGDKTFTLAAAAGTENVAEHIDDGTGSGSLTLVKEGTSNLSIQGTNTFSGKIISKGGRIKLRTDVDPNVHFSWFRLTVKENAYGCPQCDTTYSVGKNDDGSAKTVTDEEKAFLQICEIALYDQNGAVLTKGITQHDASSQTFAGDLFSAASGYAGLEPGYAGIDSSVGSGVANASDLALGALFDGNNKAFSARFANSENGQGVDLDDQSTWVPIVFRLPESIKMNPAYFDIVPGRNREGVASYNGRNPVSYRLEMSTNGVDWVSCFADQNGITIPEEYPRWVSDASQKADYGARLGKGVAIEELEEWQLFPKNAEFTWFRFTVMENGWGCPSYNSDYSIGTNADGSCISPSDAERGYVQIDEIALYDKDGNNLTGGKISGRSVKDTKVTLDIYERSKGYSGLEPGYVGLDSQVGTPNVESGNLIRLFDNSAAELKMTTTGSTGSKGINLGDQSTWVPIVFRLPEGSAPAAYFDLAPGRNRFYYGSSTTVYVGSYVGRNVLSFRLEGSPDGIHWFKVIDDRLQIDIPEYHPHWLTEPTVKWSTDKRTTGKLPFYEREGNENVYCFSGIEAVNGAAIEVEGTISPVISSLGLDAASLPGALKGLKLAESGVLEMSNVGDARLTLSGILKDFVDRENIKDWQLKLDGSESTRKIRIDAAGNLQIGPAPSGSQVIIK